MADTTVAATDDEALAAALAAVHLVLEAEAQPRTRVAPHSAWRVAARYEAQGLAAARGGGHGPAWPDAARVARAARWSKGIVGS